MKETTAPVVEGVQRSPKAKAFVAHIDKLRPCYDRIKGEWDEPLGDIAKPEEVEPPEMVAERPRRVVRRPARFLH